VELLGTVILGAVCGLLGAVFVSVNTQLFNLRKRYVNTNARKVGEVVLFSAVTSFMFFGLAYVMNRCLVRTDA
jgi:chloride channel 7